MNAPEILVGAGWVAGGSGCGCYDAAIDLRFVTGTYTVFESEEQYKARGYNNGTAMRNVDFDWYPKRSGDHRDEAHARIRMRVFGEAQDMLRAEYKRYYEKKEISAAEFRALIDAFVLKYIKPEHILQMLAAEYDYGHEDGKEEAQRKMRAALGIHR